jgi:type III restriction enzyme
VNPQEFAAAAAAQIRRTLVALVASGIVYKKTGECYEQSQVWGDHEIDLFGLCAPVADSSGRSPYNRVACDSKIEQGIVRDLQHRDDVTLFAKLPRAFTVSTPVGTYNPDWAVVIEREGAGPRLYLICESKESVDDLRPDEQTKSDCGKAHFAGLNEQIEFNVVTSASEIG